MNHGYCDTVQLFSIMDILLRLRVLVYSKILDSYLDSLHERDARKTL